MLKDTSSSQRCENQLVTASNEYLLSDDSSSQMCEYQLVTANKNTIEFVDESESMSDNDALRDERMTSVNLASNVDAMNIESSKGQLGTLTTPRKLKKKKLPAYKIRKIARNSGKSYFDKRGKFISEKAFKYQHCRCRYKCKEFNAEQRTEVFQQFWKSANWQSQTNFISSSVKVFNPKRRSVENSRKKLSRSYFLHDLQVCKLVYLNTLGISNTRVDYALKKCKLGISSPDKRGMHPSNRTSLDQISNIREFLDKVAKYKSHYSTSQKQYFSPDLNKRKLYQKYKEHQQDSSRKCVSSPVFCKVLSAYNVGFYLPKTDTCQQCDALAVQLKSLSGEEKILCQEKLNKHHERAEQARTKLREATLQSKEDKSVLTFTFDMQKVHSLPHMQTSVVYYKRQLSVFNLGINTCSTNQGHMAMWTENEGKRGANDVCSALSAYLNSIDTQDVKKIYSFSDTCGGQNRNKTLLSFCMWVCDYFKIDEWEHIYLESGHSYLPNDRDFSVIEKHLKSSRCPIYSKNGWFDLVLNSSLKTPFKVIDMRDKFYQFDQLAKCRSFNKSKTNDANPFNFLKLKAFTVKKQSDIVRYRTQDSGNQVFELRYPMENPSPQLIKCEYDQLKISKDKFEDLLSLLKYIPPAEHSFYQNLAHN